MNPRAPGAPGRGSGVEATSPWWERRFGVVLAGVLVLGLILRLLFLTADPPWGPGASVGIVWHDEGAWTHNARNLALWGTWRTDAWNPVFIAPVFTALEYVSFAAFGVGLWQARLVSVVAGLVSIAALGLGLARVGGRTAGLVGAGLLATNLVWVMYTRAALMEATMVAWLAVAWYAFVRAQTRPAWGVAAALAAWLAYFTKASAVFFLGALALVAAWPLVQRVWHRVVAPATARSTGPERLRRTPDSLVLPAWSPWILASLAVTGLAALAVLWPVRDDYWFYNWQMSVTRKPAYDIRSLVDRVSWFPIVHDFFTRMWFTTIVAVTFAIGVLARWRDAAPPTRLLTAWLALGTLELVARDVGNERYLVYLIPALAGLAALALGEAQRLLPADLADVPRRRALLALPLVLAAGYLIGGALARLAFGREISPSVRLGAAVAIVGTALVYATWPRIVRLLSARAIPGGVAMLLAGLVMAGDLVQYGQWAARRTYRNVEAMRLVGTVLPPGTLVHGKLANGLALENRIRPIFVGRGFGNYDDRYDRDDARYLLTYVRPWIGYEGPVIREVLDAYPGHRILLTFPVAESPLGTDLAALIDKGPRGARPGELPDTTRARD
ncbi:MAG: glycosyltransferase family 39 protein [Vicinamibacteraceae bacterium]|nr:glycosyltransferase family 39 protein [Vicinamibacteraceae bacterium]